MKQAETQLASFALPLPFSLSPPLSILLSKGARARTLSPLLLVLSIYAYVSLFLSLIPALSFPLSLPLSLSLSDSDGSDVRAGWFVRSCPTQVAPA